MLIDFLKAITIGDIALTLAFVAGVIGSIAAIKKFYTGHKTKESERERAFIQEIVEVAVKKAAEPLETRLANAEKQLTETNKKLEAVNEVLNQNNVQTCRLDLNDAIDSMPHEHKAILDLAWHYFVELGGDVWMSGKFRKWADDEQVDIGYIVERAPHLKG